MIKDFVPSTNYVTLFEMAIMPLITPVESLLQQLLWEQEEVDTLRTTVEEERRYITQETQHEARLAEVNN